VMSSLTSEVACLPMYTVNGTLFWTAVEKQRLMNAYRKVPKGGLLLLFPDRTWSAIKTMACLLRIPGQGRRYTPEEDRLLVELRGMGLSYRVAAEHFTDRGPQSLMQRMKLLKKRRRRGGCLKEGKENV